MEAHILYLVYSSHPFNASFKWIPFKKKKKKITAVLASEQTALQAVYVAVKNVRDLWKAPIGDNSTTL